MTERRIDVEGDGFAIAYPPAEGAAIVPALSVFPRRRYVREPEPRWLVPSQNDDARQLLAFADEFGFTVTLEARSLHTNITRPDSGGWTVVADREIEYVPGLYLI